MSKPERICWLNIILASVFLLLVRRIYATELNDDVPNTTPQPTDFKNINNYESIDIAQHEGNDNLHVQTGQTTRIITSGEIDDNFWLKHLGEDFKYAIHLQVGDSDHYNGIYNMTEDGSNYDVNHDYRIKEIPVDGDRKETPKEIDSRHENQTFPENMNVNYTTSNEEASDNYKRENFTMKHESNDYKGAYILDERVRDLVKKQSASKNQNEIYIPYHTKYTKPSKIQNINIRYAHKEHHQTQQEQGEQHEQTQTQNEQKDTNNHHSQEKESTKDSSKFKASPIVVTLPHNDKTIHRLADENTPVVVKMPPVIYHQNPTYGHYVPEESTNQRLQLDHPQHTILTQHQYMQHQIPQPLIYENTDFTQYNHISPHAKHSQPLTPQAHLQQYYNPSLLNMETPEAYSHNDILYPSSAPAPTPAPAPALDTDTNSILNQNSKEELQKSADTFHFILRKPSTPYNEQATHNQMPSENVV